MKNDKNRLQNKSDTSESSLTDWDIKLSDWNIELPDWNIELPDWSMPDLPTWKDILEPTKGVRMVERNKKHKNR